MQRLRDFHHYSSVHPSSRTPVERLEERVVELLLDPGVPDDRRDSSTCFELKHSSAVTQFSRLLARRRALPVELCAVGGLLHDIYVIVDGSYAHHAEMGAPIARAMVEDVVGFSEAEIGDLESLVRHHSDKHLVSDDPFAEFGKDVDVLDCFLYPGAFEWYLANKPLPVFQHYLARAQCVWGELGVPSDPGFAVLDDYEAAWLDSSIRIDPADFSPSSAVDPGLPFLLLKEADGWRAHFRAASWKRVMGGRRQAERQLLTAAAEALVSLAGPEETSAAMVWPAIDRIELLPPARLDARLIELLGRPAADFQLA
jgi:hypothetical protein